MNDPKLDLPLRTVDDTDGEVRRVMGKLNDSGTLLKIHRVLANSTTTFRPLALLARALMVKSPLPADVREVVILHLAASRGIAYEWEEHVALSSAAGVTENQRQSLRDGEPLDGDAFTDGQRLGVQIADAVTAGHSVPNDLWARAVTLWGSEAAADLLIAVSFWGGFIPTFITAVGLESPETALAPTS